MIFDRETKIREICKRNKYSLEYMVYWLSHPFCEIEGCNESAGPPHHIKSRGAGGGDNKENLISLGIKHDRAGIHQMGWKTFADKHGGKVREKIYKAMGYEELL